MTEGVASGGRLILAGNQGAGQGRKERLPDAPAFGEALKEMPVPTPENAQAMEKDTRQLEWRLADLLEKVTIRQQGDGNATEIKGSAERLASPDEGTSDSANFKLPTTDSDLEKKQDHADTGNEPYPAPAGGGTLPNEAPAQNVPARPEPANAREPELLRGKAEGAVPAKAEKTAVVEANLRQPPTEPMAGRTQQATAPNSENNPQQLLNQAAKRPSALAAGQNDGSFGGKNSGGEGRDAQSGKQPFRVISTQSAPAPSSPSLPAIGPSGSAFAGTLAADPGFGTAAAEAARAIAAGQTRGPETLHTLKIQLRPAELGNVTARLSISGEQLVVELSVETAEARQKLSADGEAMTRALRALGYEVDRVTIQQTSNSPGAGPNAGLSGRDAGGLGASSEGSRQDGSGAGGPHGDDRGQGGAGGERPREEDKNAHASDSLYI